MAGRTCPVIEVERQDLVRSSTQAHLVTIRAGDRHVSSCQNKTRISVLGDSERRTVKIPYGMATLATILIRRRSELPVMDVLVAIQTLREFHFVKGIFARRNMAFFTRNAGMFSFQRIVRSRMFFHAKLRGFPAADRVALRAFPLGRASLELAFMGIWRVAIRALRERQGALEIASSVALGAPDLEVHPQQRIFCFRVIERDRHVDLFPATRRVAGFAGSLEGPLMRVCMASGAGVEFDPGILYGEVWT